MTDLRFRIFFGGKSATADDLRLIDEISVEQREDAAWEARITMALCLDERGRWERQGEIDLRPRSAVRIELKVGPADFAPLIDGPIVSVESAMDARPGRSTATIVVHDDSAWLNLASEPVAADGRSDDTVARELFLNKAQGHIASAVIRLPTATTPPSLGTDFAQLGTPMQMLRYLAERHGCHAYVLPGVTPGASRGILAPDTENPPTLPPLVLLGNDRNLADVTATEDPESSERTVAHALRFSDQELLKYTTKAEDESLLEARPAAANPSQRMLPPGENDAEDPAARARARARRRNYPVTYSGRLIPGCYHGILQPYQKVALRAGAARASTIVLLTQVTHRITPSLYSVEFEGRGNSLAELAGSVPGIPAGIL